MMEHWIATTHGGPDVLMRVTGEMPAPGPGAVRIAIEACALNFADLLMLKGTYQSMPPLPFAPGAEVCGTVEAVGKDVDAAMTGQRVIACCGHGGIATHVIAPAQACFAAPDGMDAGTAASLPIAYGSADLALRHRARLSAGDWLIVSGAGGGVGLTGVELGAGLGARVIGLARGAEKAEAARSRGAEIVLDPDDFDLESRALGNHLLELSNGHGMDVIYDAVGGPLFRAMLRGAAFEARAMPIGFASGEAPPLKANHLLVKNIDVIGFWWGAYLDHAPAVLQESLSRLVRMAGNGTLRPLIAARIPFAQAPEGLVLLAERRATGKVVIEMDQRPNASRT